MRRTMALRGLGAPRWGMESEASVHAPPAGGAWLLVILGPQLGPQPRPDTLQSLRHASGAKWAQCSGSTLGGTGVKGDDYLSLSPARENRDERRVHENWRRPAMSAQRPKPFSSRGYRCQVTRSPTSPGMRSRTSGSNGEARPPAQTVLIFNAFHWREGLSQPLW